MEKITKEVSIRMTVEMNSIELSLTQEEWDTIENSETDFGIRQFNRSDGLINPAYNLILENVSDLEEWVEEIEIDIEDDYE